MNNDSFAINGVRVAPGQRASIDLTVGRLYTHSEITMPVQVVHGKKPGHRLFVCAAIHGDEINGVEIIRRLLNHPALRRLRGVLIAVPVVNIHGFINTSRYLPDRRDLNRSFPGSAEGSLAARLADLFMSEVVSNSTHGIDLHTAAIHRNNLPQIRGNLDNPDLEALARAFGVPVLLNAAGPEGSLRRVASDQGVPTLIYEAGEALRFDEASIRAGVRGIINMMRHLGMLAPSTSKKRKPYEPFVARSSAWIRSPESGICRASLPLGARVGRGDKLGVIADPFGEKECMVTSPISGVVIGRTNLPLVNEGDALFHIARFEKLSEVAQKVEAFQEESQVGYPETLDEPPLA